MKRIIQSITFTVCAIVFTVLFASCEKPNNELIMSGSFDFVYEEIPGFGNSDLPASGVAFQLPAGVEYAGAIAGYDPYKSKAMINEDNKTTKQLLSAEMQSRLNQEYMLKNKANIADSIMGSGSFVEILIPLKNTTASSIAVSFPAGLIFHAISGEYQNGLLIKQVDVTIPANGTFNLVLQLYCCNVSRSASSNVAVFNNLIVSDHAVIVQLCGLVVNKRVNIEDYYTFYSMTPYYDLRTSMQSLIWRISIGNSISQNDMNFINSIANE
jgi:hypothetical protein